MENCKKCKFSSYKNGTGKSCSTYMRSIGRSDWNYCVFEPITEETKPSTSKPKRRKIMETIKNHFRKNSDTYTILGVLILLDFFIFEGKFSNKIENLAKKLVDKVETKLLGED